MILSNFKSSYVIYLPIVVEFKKQKVKLNLKYIVECLKN